MKHLIIHTDGGARGNPGPAAIGVDIKSETGEQIVGIGRKIGATTNNIAEYTAVIVALQWLKESETNVTESDLVVKFYLDSLLVVNQLNGIYKVKEPHLRSLLLQIRQLEQEVSGKITYSHVRREMNKDADRLVNQALDGFI
jgi:ribonuclease HI